MAAAFVMAATPSAPVINADASPAWAAPPALIASAAAAMLLAFGASTMMTASRRRVFHNRRQDICQLASWMGLAQSWCYDVVAIGRMRARSNSAPARPYIARFRALSRLIWPSVCPLLQGVTTALRMAAISLWIVCAKRCMA
jgi:hypothetical protein